MSALRKYEINETCGYEAVPVKQDTGWLPKVIITGNGTAVYEPALPAAAEVHRENAAKNIALFLAAPFIGLAYLLAMPFVALGMLAWFGGKALAAKVPATKCVALTLAAPFIGLAAVVVAPFAGLGALAWIGAKAVAAH